MVLTLWHYYLTCLRKQKKLKHLKHLTWLWLGNTWRHHKLWTNRWISDELQYSVVKIPPSNNLDGQKIQVWADCWSLQEFRNSTSDPCPDYFFAKIIRHKNLLWDTESIKMLGWKLKMYCVHHINKVGIIFWIKKTLNLLPTFNQKWHEGRTSYGLFSKLDRNNKYVKHNSGNVGKSKCWNIVMNLRFLYCYR